MAAGRAGTGAPAQQDRQQRQQAARQGDCVASCGHGSTRCSIFSVVPRWRSPGPQAQCLARAELATGSIARKVLPKCGQVAAGARTLLLYNLRARSAPLRQRRCGPRRRSPGCGSPACRRAAARRRRWSPLPPAATSTAWPAAVSHSLVVAGAGVDVRLAAGHEAEFERGRHRPALDDAILVEEALASPCPCGVWLVRALSGVGVGSPRAQGLEPAVRELPALARRRKPGRARPVPARL